MIKSTSHRKYISLCIDTYSVPSRVSLTLKVNDTYKIVVMWSFIRPPLALEILPPVVLDIDGLKVKCCLGFDAVTSAPTIFCNQNIRKKICASIHNYAWNLFGQPPHIIVMCNKELEDVGIHGTAKLCYLPAQCFDGRIVDRFFRNFNVTNTLIMGSVAGTHKYPVPDDSPFYKTNNLGFGNCAWVPNILKKFQGRNGVFLGATVENSEVFDFLKTWSEGEGNIELESIVVRKRTGIHGDSLLDRNLILESFYMKQWDPLRRQAEFDFQIEFPSVSSNGNNTITISEVSQEIRSTASDSESDDDNDISQVSTRRDSSSSSSSDSDDDIDLTAITKTNQKPVRTRFGVLLQHRIKLEEDSKEIIRKSGQKMDENFFSFTTEEDRKIKENWQRFAEFHKFSGHIFEFLGFDNDGLELKKGRRSENVSIHVYHRELWPSLCRGLDNRFAKLVRLRISYIFHPYFREEQDWDIGEVKRRLDNDESLAEISETLRIPPRFLERKFAKHEKVDTLYLAPKQRIFMLKMLFESVIESGDNKFSPKNFDWKVFRNKCRENSIDPPEPRNVNETFRKRFAGAEKAIFQHLDPPATLKNKLIYVYEAYLRFSIKVPSNNQRRSQLPLIRLDTLFTIVFEDYNKNGEWNPPPALERYAKQVDLEKVRERVTTVIQKRKRLNETPKAKIRVIVKKRSTLEDLRGSTDSRGDDSEDQELEISSIRGDSTTTGSVTFDQTENPDDPLTEFEMSTMDDNTSTINETILAGGGTGTIPRGNGDESSLGGINLSQSTQPAKKPEETVQLDMSQDIWSQLVGSQ
ncbi:hypothetical protein GCK72_020552 [Caenorhabditis remanei]|uniref:Uncharacterized protein n=1 Tax=Caenorhabditis remanei TaxID=31234 RepID=A0A6A5GGV4_CAERE|nr:hypothetical protein GCK72_020552 [Caenorhabditis remanei]KAF1753994.1 hypothetical protein GCK72_020552 [Caenorhabditis remanei]